MEGKTGRTKGKENTCRTVGITKALADSGHSTAVDIPPPWIFHRRGYSTARKGFFYFFALKFGYSIETKNPNASPDSIRWAQEMNNCKACAEEIVLQDFYEQIR